MLTMKKTFSIITILLSFGFGNAFAKTQGSYAQFNILHTTFFNQDFYGSVNEESDLGFGVEYKHAFNFNDFFIAPAAFYNRNNVYLNYSDRDGNSYADKLNYSHGFKSDFGYDITDKFAIFITLGLAKINVSTKADFGTNVDSSNGTEKAHTYGGGVKYSVSDNFDIQFSYESLGYTNKNIQRHFDPEVFKLGFAYKL